MAASYLLAGCVVFLHTTAPPTIICHTPAMFSTFLKIQNHSFHCLNVLLRDDNYIFRHFASKENVARELLLTS